MLVQGAAQRILTHIESDRLRLSFAACCCLRGFQAHLNRHVSDVISGWSGAGRIYLVGLGRCVANSRSRPLPHMYRSIDSAPVVPSHTSRTSFVVKVVSSDPPNDFTMITGLHHVNLVVPPSTLPFAREFYGDTLGLTPRAVPQLQRETLAWFDMGTSGQQVHVAIGKPADFAHTSSRHPCFRVGSVEDLVTLRQRIWEHYERGGESAPKEADKPGEKNSGAEGVEYPTRFFVRDFAGNRLEFSV
jgi:extradiol dioxygenase family protein